MTTEDLRQAIRDVPDFPEPGILFKDITPILQNYELFHYAVALFAGQLEGRRVDKIAAIDARGFLFGGALCERLGAGLIPVRKSGKLPSEVFEETYDLEYGTATLAIHRDALNPGDQVVLVDDLLATGGTAAAAARLVEKAGGQIVQIQFLIELTFLNGRQLLPDYEVFAPITF